jgi:hypothetical protein
MADSTRSDLVAAGLILVGGTLTGKILVDQVLLAKESPGRGKTEMMPATRRSQVVTDDLVAYGAFIFGVYLTLTQLPDLIAEWKRIAP